MSFLKFLISKIFWISLLLIAIICTLLFYGVTYGLKTFTNYNQTIEVPNLFDNSVIEASKVIKKTNLRYTVNDSTYVPGKSPGLVINQYPEAGQKVKEKRRIFLTITSTNAPEVTMPNLIDKSKRYATSLLVNMGLKVGKIKRKPDLAKDAILAQLYKGERIEEGTLVAKGSTIDLVVGSGYGSSSVRLPDLQGYTYESAVNTIESSSLRVGALIADNTVVDTATAIIYKQSPEYIAGVYIPSGQSIDIFVTHFDNYGLIKEQEQLEEENKLKELEEQKKQNKKPVKESNPYNPDEWEGTTSEEEIRSKKQNNPYDNSPE